MAEADWGSRRRNNRHSAICAPVALEVCVPSAILILENVFLVVQCRRLFRLWLSSTDSHRKGVVGFEQKVQHLRSGRRIVYCASATPSDIVYDVLRIHFQQRGMRFIAGIHDCALDWILKEFSG
jgi:hypothetical protein